METRLLRRSVHFFYRSSVKGIQVTHKPIRLQVRRPFPFGQVLMGKGIMFFPSHFRNSSVVMIHVNRRSHCQVRHVLFSNYSSILDLLAQVGSSHIVFVISSRGVAVFLSEASYSYMRFRVLFPPSFSVASLLWRGSRGCPDGGGEEVY